MHHLLEANSIPYV